MSMVEIGITEIRQTIGRYVEKFLNGSKEPVVLTSRGDKVALIIPYTEEDEIFADAQAGKTPYNKYRELMLAKGIKDLTSGNVKVRPADIINSERVEDEKMKTKILMADYALEAAKFFSLSANVVQKCPDCGHTMLPDGLEALLPNAKPTNISPTVSRRVESPSPVNSDGPRELQGTSVIDGELA